MGVIEVPDNSYTQTTSCNGNSFGVLYAIIFIIVFSLIGFLIYSVTRKAPSKTIKEPTKARKTTFTKDTEKEKLCQKIYTLDHADLSKVDGFIEALLTNEKYQNTAEENIQESD